MKIQVSEQAKPSITIPFPNRLLFNPRMIRLGLSIGKRNTEHIPHIPQDAVVGLCDAIRDLNKRHKDWELVRVESAEGQLVIITL